VFHFFINVLTIPFVINRKKNQWGEHSIFVYENPTRLFFQTAIFNFLASFPSALQSDFLMIHKSG